MSFLNEIYFVGKKTKKKARGKKDETPDKKWSWKALKDNYNVYLPTDDERRNTKCRAG